MPSRLLHCAVWDGLMYNLRTRAHTRTHAYTRNAAQHGAVLLRTARPLWQHASACACSSYACSSFAHSSCGGCGTTMVHALQVPLRSLACVGSTCEDQQNHYSDVRNATKCLSCPPHTNRKFAPDAFKSLFACICNQGSAY